MGQDGRARAPRAVQRAGQRLDALAPRHGRALVELDTVDDRRDRRDLGHP